MQVNAADKSGDRLIVPGERIGFITKNTTEAELQQLLPKEQIERSAYYEGEGSYRCATKLFAKTAKEMTIVWMR